MPFTNTTVTSIDPKAKQVTLSDGRSLGYGALLLATGAEPVHLTIPGADLPHVCYLRTLTDSRRIIEKAKNAKRAVVIGSSFIGLEVAWSLRERKLDVAVGRKRFGAARRKFWEPKWEIWFAKRTKRMA